MVADVQVLQETNDFKIEQLVSSFQLEVSQTLPWALQTPLQFSFIPPKYQPGGRVGVGVGVRVGVGVEATKTKFLTCDQLPHPLISAFTLQL